MNNSYKEKIKEKKWRKKIFFVIFLFIFVLPLIFSFSLFFISQPTKDFPEGLVFEIKKGKNIEQISKFLVEKKIINSAFTFKLYNKYFILNNNKTSGIKSGKYIFNKKVDIFEVYKRLEAGESGIKDIKITFLSGDSNLVVSERIIKKKKFTSFNKDKFLLLAKNKEGFLYPDTYFFPPYADEKLFIKKMEENFYKKTKKILNKLKKTDKSLDKILTMASLIEKEAGNQPLSIKKKVSGVLWRRIGIGMRLQVDAVFSYIFEKHIYRVLYSHLKIDSPYNTYRNTGLPPTPIGNPIASSIEAALFPEETKNLYYITGKDGKFYYAKSYSKHLSNIKKYITNY